MHQPGRSRRGAEMDVADAVGLIRPDDVVVVGHAEPLTLLDEICRQAERLEGLTLYVWPLTRNSPYMSADARRRFRIRTLSPTLFRRYPGSEESIEYAAAHVSALSQRWPQTLSAPVVLLHVAPEVAPGRFSFGICADYTWSFQFESSRLVLAEVNELMPCPPGEAEVERSSLDAVVRSQRPLQYFVHERSPAPEERTIAEHVAELVPDGATLEVGVGSGGRAIWQALAGKRELGIHTGSLGAEALDLIESGMVGRGPRHAGGSIAAMVTGTEATLWRAGRCAGLHIKPSAFTHDVRELAKIDKFVAINSCLEVDLFGQIYSERANGRWLGSLGGQADFMRGARYSTGGMSIMALRATSRDGSQSRIRACAPPGGLVTISHSDVDFVITEYGISDLRTCTFAERARRLIGIAAPAHRERLQRELEARMHESAHNGRPRTNVTDNNPIRRTDPV